MSHFERSGPPDISDTYSLLVLNITFRTTPDDLFPLFDKYDKVVDIFVPKDRRTGESRGFAFVRYKYADEASKAVDRLDGRMVDGQEIPVQFAKYGPNAERIQKGRIIETSPRSKSSRSSSPSRKRYRDDYKGKDSRRRSRSRSYDRSERDRYRGGRDRDYCRRSRSRSASLDYKGRGRGRYDDERRSASPDYKGRGRGRYDDERHSRYRSRLVESRSPGQRSPSPRRSPSPKKSISPQKSTSPQKSPRHESPDNRSCDERSLAPQSVSPRGRPDVSPSPSRNSNGDE